MNFTVLIHGNVDRANQTIGEGEGGKGRGEGRGGGEGGGDFDVASFGIRVFYDGTLLGPCQRSLALPSASTES